MGFVLFCFCNSRELGNNLYVNQHGTVLLKVHYVAIKNKDLSCINMESFPKYALKYERRGTEQCI